MTALIVVIPLLALGFAALLLSCFADELQVRNGAIVVLSISVLATFMTITALFLVYAGRAMLL